MNAKEKAQAIQDRLAKIQAQNNGRLTPDAVVDDARDPRSPLHDQFEWDDAKAAHQYRLEQARELIRTVKCQVTVLETVIAAPHYVRDPTAAPEEQGYVAITQVRSERELARRVVHDELGRIIAAIERARAVSEVLGLTKELEDVLARAIGVRERVRAVPKTGQNENQPQQDC